MANLLGLEEQIARYTGAELGFAMYDEPIPVVHIFEEPPSSKVEDTVESPLIITFYGDGGAPPRLRISEQHSITVQTRHLDPATSHKNARDIHELLHENGGSGDNPVAIGLFGTIPVARILADFPPLRLGRDNQEQDGYYRVTQTFTVLTRIFQYA